METSRPSPDVIGRLAGWAGSFLASSLVLSVIIIFVSFGLADLPAWVGKHPVGAALVATLLVSYGVAFICLSKVRKRRAGETIQLWLVSLFAACVPLGILAYLLGLSSAVLIIGMAEVAAIVLHVAAIAIIRWQHSPPNYALERTREG